jgi:hypothetical protein
VPISNAYQLKAVVPSAEFWEIPHADHGETYGANPALYVERIVNFLEQSLP